MTTIKKREKCQISVNMRDSQKSNIKRFTHPPIDIVIGTMFAINDWLIIAENIETKPVWWTVIVIQNTRE